MTTIDIVCTTINSGEFLKPYAEEILAAGAQDRVRMIIIPDRKTPLALTEAVSGAMKAGISIECPSVIEQEAFLATAGASGMFPLDSDGRRNIGYLMAWRDGADITITIDDDNLPDHGYAGDYNWLLAHEHALTAGSMPFVTSSTGFYNPCRGLQFAPDVPVWARGFPYGKRIHATYGTELRPCEVAINAGLWFGDPDVDAITRLAVQPVAIRDSLKQGPACLGDDTWAPVNSQNTAVRREVIPAYCYFESAKRFSDIWQGYFAQACARHLGQHVRFGTPASDCAVRNDHDLLNDLRLEYDGIMMADKVLDWLTGLKLEGSTYQEAYACLREALLDYSADETDLSMREYGILYDIAIRMGDWLKVIERLA
jgi:hypothetical protein